MRSAGDVDVAELEQLRALDARRDASDRDVADDRPFLYKPGMPQDPRSLAALQRSAGNAAVGTLLRGSGRGSRPAAHRPPRPIAIQRFNPGTKSPPGTPPSRVEEQLGGGGGGGGAAPDLATGPIGGGTDESVMVGGSSPKPKPPVAVDNSKAGLSAVAAAAGAERALILEDAAASNAKLDAQKASADKQLSGHINAAKAAATAAVWGAQAQASLFFFNKYNELNTVADEAEHAANMQVMLMSATAMGTAATATAQMQQTANSVASGLKGAVGGVSGAIVGAVSGISLPDLPGVGAIKSGIKSIVQGAASGVTKGIDVVQGLISKALTKGMQAVFKAVAAATGAVMKVVSKAAQAIRAAAAKALNALVLLAMKVGSAIRTFLQKVVFPAFEKVRTTISGHFAKGTAKAKAVLKANVDYHLKMLEKVKKTATNVGAPKAGGGAGGGDDPGNAFKAIGKQARDNNKLLVNTFTGRFGQVIAGITAMAMGAAAQVATKVRGVITQVISTVTEKVQAALGVVKQIGAAVASFVQNIIGSLKSAFTNAVNWVRNVATNPVQQLTEFGSNTLNKAKNFISTAISNVLSGNFSLPGLGVGAFNARAANEGPVPVEAVEANASSGSLSVLQIVGIVVAALVGLVLLPFILASVVGLVLLAAAATVVFGPLAAVIALVIYLVVKLVKWIFTPSPLTLEHTTSNQAPDGSPKTRTTVGVGERVTIKANKLATFKASAGDPTSTSPKGQFTWRAPFSPGSADITADVVDKSSSSKVAFSVVKPSSVAAKKESEVSYPAGTQGAGMILNFTYGPTNVSFGGGEARELDGPPTGLSGYYANDGKKHTHDATDALFTIAENNTLAGPIRDRATQNGGDPPFSKGSFHWIIPNQFRADDSVNPEHFADTKQEFVIDETGTTTITKQGASVTRKP